MVSKPGPGRSRYLDERMRSQVRRLRDLSLDTIDPIAGNPSLIDEPCWPGCTETNGQQVERVLEDAYENWIEAHAEMRKSQSDAHKAKEQNVKSNDAPGKCCQVS
jgi:hypothetical protein